MKEELDKLFTIEDLLLYWNQSIYPCTTHITNELKELSKQRDINIDAIRSKRNVNIIE